VVVDRYLAGSPHPVGGPGGDADAAAVAAGAARQEPDGSVVFTPPDGVDTPAMPAVLRQPPPPAPPAAPPAPAAEAAPAPADVARLADDLYERMERRLRAELLLERERKGLLADLGGSGS
jgi:hypothetical protein